MVILGNVIIVPGPHCACVSVKPLTDMGVQRASLGQNKYKTIDVWFIGYIPSADVYHRLVQSGYSVSKIVPLDS